MPAWHSYNNKTFLAKNDNKKSNHDHPSRSLWQKNVETSGQKNRPTSAWHVRLALVGNRLGAGWLRWRRPVPVSRWASHQQERLLLSPQPPITSSSHFSSPGVFYSAFSLVLKHTRTLTKIKTRCIVRIAC